MEVYSFKDELVTFISYFFFVGGGGVGGGVGGVGGGGAGGVGGGVGDGVGGMEGDAGGGVPLRHCDGLARYFAAQQHRHGHDSPSALLVSVPHTPVLFVHEHSEHELVGHPSQVRARPYGIQEPFGPELSRRVREILENVILDSWRRSWPNSAGWTYW